MNENKKGKPYSFPDSFLLNVGYMRIYFHLPYRQTEGIIKATGKNLPVHPSYSQICIRRGVNKLDITSKRLDVDNNDGIIIAIHITGIKVTNRDQWIQEKWQIKKKKKGYLKIHIAINIKTKKILAFLEVTDEKLHDGQIMSKLIEYILKNNNNIKIKSALGDGSYDSNKNFNYLQKKKILPAIKVRKNSIISLKNNNLRNREVYSQSKDLLKWKKSRKYGSRWIAETVFSSIKRIFDEFTSAIRFHNMVKEITIKIWLYNLFRRIA